MASYFNIIQCTMIHYCEISRSSVYIMFISYSGFAEVTSDLDLETIVDECAPKQLTSLYRHLHIAPNKIENAKMDSKDLGYREQNIAVLRQWRQTNGRKALRRTVISALISSGNAEVAHGLEDIFVKNPGQRYSL